MRKYDARSRGPSFSADGMVQMIFTKDVFNAMTFGAFDSIQKEGKRRENHCKDVAGHCIAYSQDSWRRLPMTEEKYLRKLRDMFDFMEYPDLTSRMKKYWLPYFTNRIVDHMVTQTSVEIKDLMDHTNKEILLAIGKGEINPENISIAARGLVQFWNRCDITPEVLMPKALLIKAGKLSSILEYTNPNMAETIHRKFSTGRLETPISDWLPQSGPAPVIVIR